MILWFKDVVQEGKIITVISAGALSLPLSILAPEARARDKYIFKLVKKIILFLRNVKKTGIFNFYCSAFKGGVTIIGESIQNDVVDISPITEIEKDKALTLFKQRLNNHKINYQSTINKD